jgi:hypothetical protein
MLSDQMPNKRAAGKGGIPPLLAVERARPALPEHERYGPVRPFSLTSKPW